jgi:hypothetical protein
MDNLSGVDFPMSDSSSAPKFPNHSSGFNSRYDIDLFVDLEGDTTVRPVRPELRKLVMAERERIARWQHLLEQQPPDQAPPDGTNPENGAK